MRAPGPHHSNLLPDKRLSNRSPALSLSSFLLTAVYSELRWPKNPLFCNRLDRHRAIFPRRAINRLHGGDVAQPFHAVRFRIPPPTHAVRKGVQFQNELVDDFELPLKPAASYFAEETP